MYKINITKRIDNDNLAVQAGQPKCISQAVANKPLKAPRKSITDIIKELVPTMIAEALKPVIAQINVLTNKVIELDNKITELDNKFTNRFNALDARLDRIIELNNLKE